MKYKHYELGIGLVLVLLCAGLHITLAALAIPLLWKSLAIVGIDFLAFAAHQFSNVLHDEAVK